MWHIKTICGRNLLCIENTLQNTPVCRFSSKKNSGPQGSWSVHVCCLHLKMEFRSCARGRQWCCVIHYFWWTASIKPRLLFSRLGYASWGLSLSLVKCVCLKYIHSFKVLNTIYTINNGIISPPRNAS